MKHLSALLPIILLSSQISDASPTRRPIRKRQTVARTSNYGGVSLNPAPDGTEFYYIKAQINVPDTKYVDSESTPPTKQSIASWVGFGPTSHSASGQGIMQTGCAFDNLGQGSRQTRCWHEYYPDPPVFWSGFSPQPGDQLLVELTRQSPQQGLAKITDLSTGAAVSASFSAPSGYSCQGQNAEWIVESHANNAGVPAPDFGTQFFAGAVAATTGGTNFGPQSGSYKVFDQYLASNGQEIMAAGFVSGSEIQVVYQGPAGTASGQPSGGDS